MTPYFSIVVSVYNKGKFIKNTIASVLNQSFQDFELIIVNDGSTDDSHKIITSFTDKRIRYFEQQNQGAAATRNFGIKQTKSELIALLDGDDIWLPDYLETISKTIKKHPNEQVFATAIAHKYKKKITPVSYNFPIDGKTTLKNYFDNSKDHTLLSSSSIVFYKTILNTTGYFDTSIISGQDTDLWIRIGMHYSIVFINQVHVYYTYSNDSLSNTSLTVASKPKFDKYYKEESRNLKLKKFIDKNRFSLAILGKVTGDTKAYKFYKSQLNSRNLNFKQRILLNCPSSILKFLITLKTVKGKKVYYKPLKRQNSV
ncbi:glycosyltransferase family 2 protein [Bizionia sp. KMM 8389]